MLKEKLSYSFAKNLLSKPFEQVKYELEQPFCPSPIMERGNRWESAIQEGMTKVLPFKDTATRGKKFDKFREDQAEISDYYKENQFMICTEQECAETANMLKALSPEVKKIVEHSEYQVHVEYEDEGIDVHGFVDFLGDCIYDLKISDPSPDKFSKQVINFSWDLQAYLYVKAFDFQKEFKWIVISPEAPYTNRIYTANQKFIDAGKRKYETAKKLFCQFNLDLPADIEQELECPRWA
jgi:hypothetical protein